MEKIIKYVESKDTFEFGDMYREIKTLMEDLKYLELHYNRVAKSNRYQIKIIPYKKTSDKLILDYLITWNKDDISVWENMFYILKALDYLFENQYTEGWECNFEIYEIIEDYLEERDIKLSDMITWYIGCSRGLGGFYSDYNKYKEGR